MVRTAHFRSHEVFRGDLKVTSKKPIAALHKVHKVEIVQDKHTNQLHSKIKNGIKRMNKQKSLSSPEDELSQVRTKKKEFLE